MFRRWIIRCLFILPIVLCVGGWAMSTMYEVGLSVRIGGCYGRCVTHRGIVYADGGYQTGLVSGWDYEVRSHPSYLFEPNYPGFLGLAYRRSLYSPRLAVPYWFLIVSSLTLFVVWRKTRPTPNLATAFPVEVRSQGA